ncbi:hypothetical protein V1289_003244 [Bradyrhizobium sp. AZCC 2289]
MAAFGEYVAGADRGDIALEMMGPMPRTVISRSQCAGAESLP